MARDIRLQLLKREGNFDSTPVRLHTHIYNFKILSQAVQCDRSCQAVQQLDQEHAHSCMAGQPFGAYQGLQGCPATNSIQLVIQNCTRMAATAAQHVCYLQRHTLTAKNVGTHAAAVVSSA